nr:hypothetical protein [Planctomycetota bacterium]
AGGIASVIYGAWFRTVPVSEEQEIEISLAPPPGMPGFPGEPPFDEQFGGPPFGGPPFGGPPEMGGPPDMMPSLPFGMGKIKEKIIVTEPEPEPKLINEVTFGGVTLLASGDIMRTYTGEPPSLCPT